MSYSDCKLYPEEDYGYEDKKDGFGHDEKCCCFHCDRCEWKVRKAYWAGYRNGFHDALFCKCDKSKYDK